MADDPKSPQAENACHPDGESYNGGSSYKILASYTYNDLGQLVLKNLGKTTAGYLQNLDYRYNIHGQVTYINNSKLMADANTSMDTNGVFGMQYMYDHPDIATATASYTGRVSEVKWIAKNTTSGAVSNERSYVYKYDKLNRLTDAIYADRVATSGDTNPWGNADLFDENGIAYDENGNIKTLNRTAQIGGVKTNIDQLTYTYSATNPNQLSSVADGITGTNGANGFNQNGSGGLYLYDAASANVTNDPYRNIGMTYNELNETSQVTSGTSTITYTYDATGKVLRKQVNATTTTDYLDEFVYITQSGTTTLSYFAMPEGRVTYASGNYTQQYIIADQQGNARLTFQDNGGGAAQVMQETGYYAFGMTMQTNFVATSGTPNNNLYNGGSELQNDLTPGPNFYQTLNRNYDQTIGRWMGIDPKPESAESMSPYEYALNNPISFNDPLGLAATPDWKSIVNDLLNTPYGGTSDGTTTSYFGSEDEAENAGIGYIVAMGGGPGGGSAPAGNGGVFGVDAWGHIKPLTGTGVQPGPGKEILFATESTNKYDPNDPSIVLNTADVDLSQINHAVPGNDYWQVNDPQVAFKLFLFLANHTKVEWSVILDDLPNYISTSHSTRREEGAVPLLQTALKYNNAWQMNDRMVEVYHDHPNDLFEHGPSGLFLDDLNTLYKQGDEAVVRYFGNNPSIYWGVYDTHTNTIYFYNQNGITGTYYVWGQ